VDKIRARPAEFNRLAKKAESVFRAISKPSYHPLKGVIPFGKHEEPPSGPSAVVPHGLERDAKLLDQR
jgi:hypothetical protein